MKIIDIVTYFGLSTIPNGNMYAFIIQLVFYIILTAFSCRVLSSIILRIGGCK